MLDARLSSSLVAAEAQQHVAGEAAGERVVGQLASASFLAERLRAVEAAAQELALRGTRRCAAAPGSRTRAVRPAGWNWYARTRSASTCATTVASRSGSSGSATTRRARHAPARPRASAAPLPSLRRRPQRRPRPTRASGVARFGIASPAGQMRTLKPVDRRRRRRRPRRRGTRPAARPLARERVEPERAPALAAHRAAPCRPRPRRTSTAAPTRRGRRRAPSAKRSDAAPARARQPQRYALTFAGREHDELLVAGALGAEGADAVEARRHVLAGPRCRRRRARIPASSRISRGRERIRRLDRRSCRPLLDAGLTRDSVRADCLLDTGRRRRAPSRQLDQRLGSRTAS